MAVSGESGRRYHVISAAKMTGRPSIRKRRRHEAIEFKGLEVTAKARAPEKQFARGAEARLRNHRVSLLILCKKRCMERNIL